MNYTLNDFNNIIFDGFDFVLPEETINLISELSLEVGSPSYIKTPVFKKKDVSLVKPLMSSISTESGYKKRKGNKGMEVINDDDWETLRTFHTTVIQQKVGIDVQIDLIRSHLNKMSDKNFVEMKTKIFEVLDALVDEDLSGESKMAVSTSIFDIASANRFYSKLYADLYSELIVKYPFMKEVFVESFDSFIGVFNQIEYVDPDKNYDQFCRINKDNERRRSLSSFFVNLTLNGLITKADLLNVICKLMGNVFEYIVLENKKNEVDELTENIYVLCGNKSILETKDVYVVDGMTIEESIKKLANSKSKTYPSLSNKSIFKYMDMIEM